MADIVDAELERLCSRRGRVIPSTALRSRLPGPPHGVRELSDAYCPRHFVSYVFIEVDQALLLLLGEADALCRSAGTLALVTVGL